MDTEFGAPVGAISSRAEPNPRSSPLERALLVLMYVVVLAALAGFATFGLHPGLLGRLPGAAPVYGLVFGYVGQVQVWLAGAVLMVVLTRRAGTRWIPAFVGLYALSFASEFLGTRYGVPFGGYAYSDLLGAKWLARVPVVIPLSWFCMAVPSYYLARRLAPGQRTLVRIVGGALVLLAWDLALDPAMSFLTPYWRWVESGPYYGMPWLNLFGWFVTGLVLMAALSTLRSERWIDPLPGRWVAAFYLANLLMPLGMMVAAGLWLGVGVTIGAYAVLLLARGAGAQSLVAAAAGVRA
jgi:uncharacterized membrane protein